MDEEREKGGVAMVVVVVATMVVAMTVVEASKQASRQAGRQASKAGRQPEAGMQANRQLGCERKGRRVKKGPREKEFRQVWDRTEGECVT